jgi:hypothetical protein
MKTKFFFALLSLLSTPYWLLTGCDSTEVNPPSTTWYVLVDTSGVRENMETRQHYAGHLRTVFSNLAPGDAVVVALITEMSIAEPSFLVRHQFQPFKASTDNELYQRAEQEKFTADFNQKKDQLLSEAEDFILHNDRIAPKTDIITACHVASAVLKQNPAAYKKLIIVSDMEEYDGTYNFIKDKLDEERIRRIIAQEQASPRKIPDLGGVNVFVAGASSKDSERFFKIRNFWQAYFREAGATLSDEDYGATLIRF